MKKLDDLIDKKGLKEVPAIQFIEQSRREMQVIEHSIEFIFGYSRGLKEAENE